MDKRLAERLQDVPGFGACPRCPYVASGPAELCYACARREMQGLSPPSRRCEICDRPYDEGEQACRNPICSSYDRQFAWNFSIAMRSGVLERAINAYKFRGATGWAVIFGRILAGFLEQEAQTFRDFDLIVASPGFLAEGGRRFDHTRLVLQRAAEEVSPGSTWPFDLDDVPAIVKTCATDPLTGATYQQRREIAETQLRPALQVPRPARTRGARILVYDDIFTDGRTLNEVARALRDLGHAEEICGVTLCRQPFRGHPSGT